MKDLNDLKKEIFLKKLKPIEDWNKVKCGQKIFHKTNTHISLYDTFCWLEYDVFMGEFLICYMDIYTHTQYALSKKNWYYYDEDLARKMKKVIQV